MFTICAKNYTGLAMLLRESVKRYYQNTEFFIFIADEIDSNFQLPDNTFIVKDIGLFSDTTWDELTFKYDITEFCTCLKPFLIEYLLCNKQFDNVCYCDPDLFFFSSAEFIFKKFIDYDILLTPHITGFRLDNLQRNMENELRFAGAFNLGFIGITKKKDTITFLQWWKRNLLDKCFSCRDRAEFTDQKWIDFLPSLYPDNRKIYISHDLGWNFAPWNYYERKFRSENGRSYVESRYGEESCHELVFAHFSGFNYKKLIETGEVEQKTISHNYDSHDITMLILFYCNELRNYRNVIETYFYYSYTYNSYKNQMPIHYFHRRLFNAFVRDGITITEPFSSEGFLYNSLKRKKMIVKTVFSVPSEKDISNISGKTKLLHFFQKIIFNLLGYEMYLQLVNYLKKNTTLENQVFLLK